MLDFPASPTDGQQFAAPNGVVYQFAAPTNIWTTAFVGNPSGPAGGDLSGSYPDPAIKSSVALTGSPTALTPLPGDNDTSIATTAWVNTAIAGIVGGAIPSGPAGGDLSGTYPGPTIKASVALTGTPTAPTPPVGDDDQSIATTAWVRSEREASGLLTVMDFGAVGDGTTDDTAAFNAAGACGKTVYVPVGTYSVPLGNVTVSTGTEFIGLGNQKAIVQLGAGTNNGVFIVGGNNVAFRNLHIAGNSATHPSASTSAAITAVSVSDVVVDGCLIENFVGDGIVFNGVTRATASSNTIRNIRTRAGIACARNLPSTDVHVTDNHISFTGEANVHAYVGIEGWVVTGNYCDTAGTTTASDNITGYTLASAAGHDWIVSDNVCKNSANNGIHVTAFGVLVSNNTIRNPASAGIAVQFAPIPLPEQSTNAIVTGNDISFASNTSGLALGVVLRDVTEFVISGNIIRNPYTGIRVQAYGTNVIRNGAVIGNVVTDIGTNGIEFQTDVSQVVVDSNVFQGGVSDFVDFSGHTPSENQIGANNFSVGATNLLRRLVVNHGTSSVVPSIRAVGSAPDISMRFVTKGTGVVSFGTYTATPGAITGYITITDAGGTIRKLAVTS